MPRPVTKGERIQIQLPLDVDKRVRKVADDRGVTPAAVIASILEARFVPRAAKLDECKHVHRDILGGGLAKCRDCGARRLMKGEWVPT